MSQEMLIFVISSSIISLLFSLVSLIIGSYAAIKSIAVEKSTHSVTYMPIDEAIDKENQKFMEGMTTEEDTWVTTEEAIKKQLKAEKEDLEFEMPEFALADEDKKRYSF